MKLKIIETRKGLNSKKTDWSRRRISGGRAKLLIAGFVGMISLGLEGSEANSLFERSPFLPSGFKDPDAVKAEKPMPVKPHTVGYLFQGVYQINGNYRFNLLDTKTQESRWVSLSDHEGMIQVIRFDPELNQLEIEQGGGVSVLSLVKGAEPSGGEARVNGNGGGAGFVSNGNGGKGSAEGSVGDVRGAEEILGRSSTIHRPGSSRPPRGVGRYRSSGIVGGTTVESEEVVTREADALKRRNIPVDLGAKRYQNPRYRSVP